jgi:predicted nucleotidyltransferase component of viral defense system
MTRVVRATGAPHHVVLKDYALSYLLAGIYSDPELAGDLVFKGGTCLRKCFFADYRFSEDLDFTLREGWDEPRLVAALVAATETAASLARHSGAFRFAVERREHQQPHPFRQLDFRIRVDFPTGATLPIKVEMTQDEPIVLPTTLASLIHQFEGEDLAAEIQAYSLDEIAVEKLRALVQTRQILGQRNWASRARDLYDLYFLWRQDSVAINWAGLRGPLKVKAQARGVEFAGPADFHDDRVLNAYRPQWEQRLAGFVRDLPPFDEAVGALDEILSAVFA